MLILISEHWVKPGQMDNANKIFQTVTDNTRGAPGLISRYIAVSQKDPMKVTTVTTWQSQEAATSWRQSHPLSISRDQLEEAFSNEVSERYDATQAL